MQETKKKKNFKQNITITTLCKIWSINKKLLKIVFTQDEKEEVVTQKWVLFFMVYLTEVHFLQFAKAFVRNIEKERQWKGMKLKTIYMERYGLRTLSFVIQYGMVRVQSLYFIIKRHYIVPKMMFHICPKYCQHEAKNKLKLCQIKVFLQIVAAV